MAPPSNAIMEGMSKLYQDETTSDFILAAGDQEWKVHKFVLRFHSDVLYKMATSDQFIECKTGRAELKDADPTHVDALVHYLYNCDYSLESDTKSRSTSFSKGPHYVRETNFHLGVSVLADMYNIQGLIQLATSKISEYFKAWHSEFAALVANAYEKQDAPEVIMKVFATAAAENMRCLHSQEGEELLRKRPKFAVECALACAERDYKARPVFRGYRSTISISDSEYESEVPPGM